MSLIQKNKLKRNSIFLVAFLALFIVLNISVNQNKIFAASSASNNQTKAGFFVQPFFDNNASAGADATGHPYNLWYDNVKPGSKVPVTVLITNQSSKERSFKISANTGYTTNAGQTDYSLTKPDLDSTIDIKFRSLFKNNDVVVNAPGSGTNNGQVAVSLVAEIPNDNFKGVVLGGIRVMANDPTDAKSIKTTSIVNKFAYQIPVIFNINGKYEHNSFLSNSTIKVGTIVPNVKMQGRDAVTSIIAKVRNTSPTILTNFRTRGVVTKKGSSTVEAQADTTGNQMAPNSVWNYAMNWGKRPLQAGDYHLTLKVKVDGDTPVSSKTSVDKKYDYKIEKDFTITAAQADQLNRQAGIKPDYLWLWITLGVLGVILIILIVWWLARRNKKSNKV